MSTDLRRTAWRIGLQTAGLLIACLLVVSTVVYVAVVRSQEQHLSQTLTDAVAAAAPATRSATTTAMTDASGCVCRVAPSPRSCTTVR